MWTALGFTLGAALALGLAGAAYAAFRYGEVSEATRRLDEATSGFPHRYDLRQR